MFLSFCHILLHREWCSVNKSYYGWKVMLNRLSFLFVFSLRREQECQSISLIFIKNSAIWWAQCPQQSKWDIKPFFLFSCCGLLGFSVSKNYFGHKSNTKQLLYLQMYLFTITFKNTLNYILIAFFWNQTKTLFLGAKLMGSVKILWTLSASISKLKNFEKGKICKMFQPRTSHVCENLIVICNWKMAITMDEM